VRLLAIIHFMDNRDERLARNEAASREINERLETARRTEPGRYIRMICECGREVCDRVIAITPDEYEEIRSDPIQFVVVRDHIIGDIERVILETDRFAVVAKREGIPAEVAIQEDPRS
jgi:hypothetical protein